MSSGAGVATCTGTLSAADATRCTAGFEPRTVGTCDEGVLEGADTDNSTSAEWGWR